jgi:FkbM family methyltransferase
MKYYTIILNHFKYKAFKKIVGLNHINLTRQTIYYSVFLNDVVSDSIQVTGLFESEILIPLFEILSKRFDFKESTAIDIGANIGNHSIFFSDIFEKVISFEPNPITYKLLSVNTFSLHNIHIVNLGLSDTDKEISLSVQTGNIGASSAIINRNSGLEHKIRVIRLDDFQDLPSNIELLKIDAEGMETHVLNGANELIRSTHPIILFEQWASELRNMSSDSIDLLKDLGYLFFILVESNFIKNKWLRRLKRIPLLLLSRSLNYKLQKIESFEPIEYGMIVAIHQSRVDTNITFLT